jgi:integrase
METRKTRNGYSYRGKVYVPGCKPLTKTFDRKTDARDWENRTRAEVQKNIALGLISVRKRGKLHEVFSLWLERRVRPSKSQKTIDDYNSIAKKHLLKRFGSIDVRSIERSHADHLIFHLKENGLANKTINKVMTVFKQVMTFSENEGYVGQTPLRNFPMLKEAPGSLEFLSQQEILQLLRANSTTDIYAILVIALNTGMRIGEIAGLCWDRVNFETNVIEVSRTRTRYGLKETTKTNIIRHIPMNTEVRLVIENLFKHQRSPRYVLVDPRARAYNPDHFSKRHFSKALARAGIRATKFHTLRHTYASQFMMNGGNIYDLQKILGHTEVSMTMRYAHLSPQHMRKAVSVVRFSAEGNFSNSPIPAPPLSGDNNEANVRQLTN